MSIYQRGENWYIDFTFKGQRIRESIGPSRKSAEKIIAKKKTEIAENKFLDVRKDPDPVTFHEFAKEYWKWAKANHKPSSWARDLSNMGTLEKSFDKNIHEITTWEIESYKMKRKATVKPATVNREVNMLKAMLSKAVEWGKLKESPGRKVKALKGEVKRLRFLYPDEIQRLLSNCQDELRPIVEMAVNTGLRKGELLNLEWEQIDFNTNTVSIVDTKNHEDRQIPLNETARKILEGMERKSPYVFRDKEGSTFIDVRYSFDNAVKKTGLQDFRFHDLRHTFASNLIMQEGVELNDVRELLGHKRIDMTLRYAHLSPKHKTRVVNVLDRLWSQNPPHEEIQESKVVEFKRR
jgi:integrase